MEPADIKAGTLFLNSRSGGQIPYSVLRLIAPSTIVASSDDVQVGEEYTAAIHALGDEPYTVDVGSFSVASAARVQLPAEPEVAAGANS